MPEITVPAIVFVPKQRELGTVQAELIDAMVDLHPGGLTWRRTFPGTLDQVPHVRNFTSYLLADSACRDDAEQIVAELAANAIQHTGSGHLHGTFIVEIARTTTTITIAVYDCGWGGVPRFGAHCRVNAECGRGLALVSTIADQVGYEGNDEVGHKVWAKIHTHASPKVSRQKV
ncbi:ATP-binding protein [Nonomuraea sp. NPDC049158]|uniref:ATP-binding protein n=1 Tax=Nonomuraea sp. NPDC049158 TaxID=3155649 RepID=UPI0033D2E3E5